MKYALAKNNSTHLIYKYAMIYNSYYFTLMISFSVGCFSWLLSLHYKSIKPNLFLKFLAPLISILRDLKWK